MVALVQDLSIELIEPFWNDAVCLADACEVDAIRTWCLGGRGCEDCIFNFLCSDWLPVDSLPSRLACSYRNNYTLKKPTACSTARTAGPITPILSQIRIDAPATPNPQLQSISITFERLVKQFIILKVVEVLFPPHPTKICVGNRLPPSFSQQPTVGTPCNFVSSPIPPRRHTVFNFSLLRALLNVW